jgi:hypothetical protein
MLSSMRLLENLGSIGLALRGNAVPTNICGVRDSFGISSEVQSQVLFLQFRATLLNVHGAS